MLCQMLIPLPLAILAESIPCIGYCTHITREVIASKVQLMVVKGALRDDRVNGCNKRQMMS
jgi:hypothetical protein